MIQHPAIIFQLRDGVNLGIGLEFPEDDKNIKAFGRMLQWLCDGRLRSQIITEITAYCMKTGQPEKAAMIVTGMTLAMEEGWGCKDRPLIAPSKAIKLQGGL